MLGGEQGLIQLEEWRTGRRQLADRGVDPRRSRGGDAAPGHPRHVRQARGQGAGMRHRHQLVTDPECDHDVGRGRKQGRHAHQRLTGGGAGNAIIATHNAMTPATYQPGIAVRKRITPPNNASVSPNVQATMATVLARAGLVLSRNFRNITGSATPTEIHAIRAISESRSSTPGSAGLQSGLLVTNHETPPNSSTPASIAKRIARAGVTEPASGRPRGRRG